MRLGLKRWPTVYTVTGRPTLDFWTLGFGHWAELHFENVRAVAAAVAIGAADEDVAEELHLDLLEAGAAAALALALGRS